ncbi:MAG: class I SAM-dependent methyltransferase [Bacillota bacterium]|nr:class I SAM-dependent methyltransferase [Bacillota bacterium]
MDLGTLGYDAFMYYFEKRGLDKLRKKVLSDVYGDVLELGPGTGINLKYYDKELIGSLTYLDIKFKSSLGEKAKRKCPRVQMIEGDAQKLPFENKSFDSVVFTLVFCSVEDVIEGLNEVKRVLKDDGRIYFIEHVEPEGGWMKKLFNKVNPSWKSFTGGCNLNRDTISRFRDAGIDIEIIGKKFNNIFVGGIGQK